MSEFILTSESVGEGHPDKVADRISDAVLDAYLARDPEARVACETLVTRGFVCVAGETRSRVPVTPEEIDELARAAIADIGYIENDGRFSASEVEVNVRLQEQASEIANAVDKADRRSQGAGDQGMMFGYATAETAELMPAPITWAHALTRGLAACRKARVVNWLRPDAKSQVSVRYANGRPVEITRIVVSTQHNSQATAPGIREFVVESLIPQQLAGAPLPRGWEDLVLVNPSGSFLEGGPATDTGLTGRKIIVDTYGGAARHGGGAFSGKDPSKVDRSAAYAARHVAKNLVAAGLVERCEVQVSYAIGRAHPTSIAVETFGTGTKSEEELLQLVRRNFDLRPAAIIAHMDLLRPIYRPTAAYGHFGRDDLGVPWEKTNKVEALRADAAVAARQS